MSSGEEELKQKKHKKSKKNKEEKRAAEDDEQEQVENKPVEQEQVNDVEEADASRKEKKKKRKHKHRDQSEEREEGVKEKETKPKEPELEVHTANNWEEADLGDEERRKKFLKLMGAAKHKDEEPADESHKHFRTKNENEKMNQVLEKQFTESLSNKIQHKNHCGLGFADDTNPKEARSNYYRSLNSGGGYNNNSYNNAKQETKPESKEDKIAKYKKMSFVKSND